MNEFSFLTELFHARTSIKETFIHLRSNQKEKSKSKRFFFFIKQSLFPSQVTPHIHNLPTCKKQQQPPTSSLLQSSLKHTKSPGLIFFIYTRHRHSKGSRRLTEGSSVWQQQPRHIARTFHPPVWCSETSKFQAPAKAACIITFPPPHAPKNTRLFSQNHTINYQARVEKSSLKPARSWIRQRWCGDEKEL